MAESPQKRVKVADSEATSAGENLPLNILVVLGTVRSGRLGSRVGKFVTAELTKRNHHVEVLDPMQTKFPILEKPLHFYGKDEEKPQLLLDWNEKIKAADAIVLVSGSHALPDSILFGDSVAICLPSIVQMFPEFSEMYFCSPLPQSDAVSFLGEYNSTIPPALSNVLDHFPLASYGYKPSAIICYSAGPAGGLRASMHLRDMCAELGCISIGPAFTIGAAQKSLDEEGLPTEQDSPLPGRLNRTVTILEWYANAMRHQRLTAGLPKL